VIIREAGTEDAEVIAWALYAALDWNPDRTLPAYEFVVEHPEAARYHREWGRPGDLGVVAELAGEVVGVAYSVSSATTTTATATSTRRRPRSRLRYATAVAARGSGRGCSPRSPSWRANAASAG
jgi:hypothetical protein